MKNEKTRFAADYHAVPVKLVTLKPFKVRAKLRLALVAYLDQQMGAHFDRHPLLSAGAGVGLLAQQLTFLVTIKSGWGPTDTEIEKVAKDLVDGYLAHLRALTDEGFQAPAEAALESLKDFEFAL